LIGNLQLGLAVSAHNTVKIRSDIAEAKNGAKSPKYQSFYVKSQPMKMTVISHFGLEIEMPSLLRTRSEKKWSTKMWANAQRDGHPAEYMWRPLFNAAKFG